MGGLHVLVDVSQRQRPVPTAINYLNILPDFTSNWDMAVAVFIMPIAVQWWAVWYPGAEPGGGSYIAQRMLASKSEKDSLGAVLFFNLPHYVLRPWPWILVGLCSFSFIRNCPTSRKRFPNLDPQLARARYCLSRNAEIPAGRVHRSDGRRADCREFFHDTDPSELGRLVPGARFLSPFYQSRRQPKSITSGLAGSRRCGLFVCSAALSFVLETAKEAFDIILQIGAGHRPAISAALVLVAGQCLVRSRGHGQLFRMSVTLLVLKRTGHGVSTDQRS